MAKSVLLLTAHPDDECMFFTPSIRAFIARGYRVDLMCLSTGNCDGIGEVRRKELEASAVVLGIKSVFIINDKNLEDGPRNVWKPETILNHVRKLIDSGGYNEIVSFDDYGISGHVNHCSISRALTVGKIKAWRLESLPVCLKYSGLIGSILCSFYYKTTHQPDTIVNVISLREAFEFGYKSMLKHESQLAWFRRLYLIFSMYMTFNLLRKK